jgi:lipoprotein-releasing system permease protein
MSRLPFELLLALRYLRPKRTFVSVITLISVLGVSLGVAVLIIVISVMSGFDHQLRDKIVGFSPQVRVMVKEDLLRGYPEILKRVAAHPLVKAVSPYVLGQVLLKTEPDNGASKVGAPALLGVDPRLDADEGMLRTNIVAGKFDLSGRGLLVGADLAASMGLGVGDRVLIAGPEDLQNWEKNRGKEGEEIDVPAEYEVRGIFEVGYHEYDANFIVTSLQTAQSAYALTNRNTVHGLKVALTDPNQAPVAQRELARMLGPGFTVTTWLEENSVFLGALVVEKNVMFYLLFFIMIVAALCILSALITFVVQKTREIGMLKALGATDLQVAGLFLSQSGFVGVVGVAAGLGLGILAVTYRNEFLRFMNRTTHFELFPASIYGFGELPALLAPADIILICGSALVICLLGGLIPAWRAGRLKPVEALRYE